MTTRLAPPMSTDRPRRHRGLAAFAGLVSLSAWFGAAGMVAGFLDLGPEVTPRLPLRSPVLGGIALALVVAVPMAAVAVLAATGHRLAPAAAVGAGVLQVGWIVVELAFIRELSFFHPLYVLVGVAFVGLGIRARPTTDEVAGRS
ncbi:MAG: hypothetical protein R2702_08335 [Acidimicrobiales bacterium]